MSSVTSPAFIPRCQRPKAWGDRASNAARATGAKAVDQALAAIDAQWGPARRANETKLDIERAMARGAHDHDVRARYGKVALLVSSNVASAIREIERNYRAEVRDRQQRERYGLPTRNPAVERHLLHARIFLRWFRRYGDLAKFPRIVDMLTTSVHFRLEAAE